MFDSFESSQFLIGEGRSRHRAIVRDAHIARAILRSPRTSGDARGVFVWLGALLIEAGRRMCERTGALRVEVAYRSIPAPVDRRVA